MPFQFQPGEVRLDAIHRALDYANQSNPSMNCSDQELMALCYGPFPKMGIQASPWSAHLTSTQTGEEIPLQVLWMDQDSQPGPLNLFLKFEITGVGMVAITSVAVNVMQFAAELAACSTPEALKAKLQSAFGSAFDWGGYQTRYPAVSALGTCAWLRALLTGWQNSDGSTPYAQAIATPIAVANQTHIVAPVPVVSTEQTE